MSSGGELEKLLPFMLTGEFMCICMCVYVQYFCIHVKYMHVQYIICVKCVQMNICMYVHTVNT